MDWSFLLVCNDRGGAKCVSIGGGTDLAEAQACPVQCAVYSGALRVHFPECTFSISHPWRPAPHTPHGVGRTPLAARYTLEPSRGGRGRLRPEKPERFRAALGPVTSRGASANR